MFDFCDQVFNTLERSTTNGPLCNNIKPDFDLIEPRSIRGCIVNLVTRMCREPSFNRGMFMGGVIVDDQMDF